MKVNEEGKGSISIHTSNTGNTGHELLIPKEVTVYAVHLSEGGKVLLSIKIQPKLEIVWNNFQITPDELLEKVKTMIELENREDAK